MIQLDKIIPKNVQVIADDFDLNSGNDNGGNNYNYDGGNDFDYVNKDSGNDIHGNKDGSNDNEYIYSTQWGFAKKISHLAPARVNPIETKNRNRDFKLVGRCGPAGRVITSNAWDPWFESSRPAIVSKLYRNEEIKETRGPGLPNLN